MMIFATIVGIAYLIVACGWGWLIWNDNSGHIDKDERPIMAVLECAFAGLIWGVVLAIQYITNRDI